jgi:type IV pilus assembly protein PilN
MTSTPLDLLHEQRLQQGLPDPAQELRAQRALVLQGALIGAAVVLACAAVTGLLVVRQQMLRSELDRLALVEAEVQAADTRLRASQTRLSTLQRANKALAQGLVNARSGSALLRDLQRRVPQDVQLTGVDVPPGGASLKLQGEAGGSLPFARINALQIELGRSPLLDPTSVRLVKAMRRSYDNKPALVSFELTAQFRKPLPPAAELQILSELGATGMAARLQQLQAEGLLR